MEGRGIGVTDFSRYKMEGRYRRSIALSLPSIFSAHRLIMMVVL
eukprot:SAG31_NODE_48444_length_188_cov_16.202247_1_plen_43_part_01